MYTSTLIFVILCFSFSNGAPDGSRESNQMHLERDAWISSFSIKHKDGSEVMYHISDDQMAYLDAVAFCEGLGAILAEPRSSAQQEEIIGVLDDDYEYWIGLQRSAEGGFVWNSDSSKVDYVIWDDNEPNGSGNCVQLCGEHDFKWEANDCASPEEFALCQLSTN